MSLRDWYKGKTISYFLKDGSSLKGAVSLSGKLADMLIEEGNKDNEK